jgi:hypothetical protein
MLFFAMEALANQVAVRGYGCSDLGNIEMQNSSIEHPQFPFEC